MRQLLAHFPNANENKTYKRFNKWYMLRTTQTIWIMAVACRYENRKKENIKIKTMNYFIWIVVCSNFIKSVCVLGVAAARTASHSRPSSISGRLLLLVYFHIFIVHNNNRFSCARQRHNISVCSLLTLLYQHKLQIVYIRNCAKEWNEQMR